MKQVIQKIDTNEEKAIWEDGIFVFDSSVLLNFYDYSNEALKVLDKKIFNLLKKRLWITNQTEYEYLRNRERVLLQPEKLYDDLITTYFDTKPIQTFKNQLQQLQNRTKKQDKHPYIKQDFFKKFEMELEKFENEASEFKRKLTTEINSKKKSIQTIKNNDTVKKIISDHFQITKGYNYDNLIEIVKEGEFRYRNTIPPGYEDTKDKSGFQIYGDLIIWKQILDLAIELKKSVILIIDDLKIDWCYQNNKDKNLIDAPREELIKEIYDKANVKFLAYSSTQFLQKSKDILNISINDEIINEANEANKTNQYTLISKIELDVIEWIKDNLKNVNSIYKYDDAGYPDIVIKGQNSLIAIEVKYLSHLNNHNIKNLIKNIHSNSAINNYYSLYDEVMIFFVCENIESAMELIKHIYELLHDKLSIYVAFLNEEKKLQVL